MEIINEKPKFAPTDEITTDFKYKGKWFDCCPIEGTSKYKKDTSCLYHARVIDKGDYYLVMTKPNFDHVDRPFESDSEDNVYISKLFKKDIWDAVNKFNDTACIYKICKLDFDDELITWLGGKELVKAKVTSYKDCDKIIRIYQ